MASSNRWIAQLAIVAFIAVELCVSVLGLETYFGFWLAAAIVMGSLILRFGLTFVIGAFLCAYLVFQWHWIAAAIFSGPALILMFPGLLTDWFTPPPA